MNNFLNEYLVGIIIFLLFIILLLIGIVGFILYRLLLNQSNKKEETLPPLNQEQANSLTANEISQTQIIKSLESSDEFVAEKLFCDHHPEVNSVGSCLICEDVFCEKCLVEHENMYFCKEHFKVFANNKWTQVTDLKTTPDNPEAGLFIYKFKRNKWKESSIPSFVLTHYRINIEEDYIESFIQLNVIEEQAEELLNEIKELEAKHLA